MKEKGKRKFNPFVGVLKPQEDLLWFYAPYIETPREHLLRFLRNCFICILVVSGPCNLLSFEPQKYGLFEILSHIATNLMAAAILLAPLFFIIYLFSAQLYQTAAYALTSERWLTLSHDHISGVLLEDMPVLSMGKGEVLLLRMPVPFPADADERELTQLAVEARKNRLKALSEGQN